MKKTMVRCLVGVALGASTLVAVAAAPAQAVEVGDGIVIGSTESTERALRQGIAYNPERDEYLAAYLSTTAAASVRDEIRIVRLDSGGAILSGPAVMKADVVGSKRFDTDVSYNADTDQYLVSWAEGNGLSDNAARTVSYGQLVSDTGALVGGPVQLHPTLGTHLRCSSVWPQHEANPATGGYTLMYTYWYSTTSDNGPCDGLSSGDTRTVVSSLGGDLSLGNSVILPTPNAGLKDNHLSVNPKTGDALVLRRTPGPSGQAVLLSPTLGQTASFSFIDDDRRNDNAISDPVGASDPESGNWLLVWGADGVTMVVDAAGNEVVAPASRLDRRVLDLDVAPDGSFWGVNSLGYLVHIGADGVQLSSTKVGRSDGNPGVAIGTSDLGVRGLAFMPTGSYSIPLVIPFSEAGAAAVPLVPARLLETRDDAEGTVDGLFEGIGPRPAGEVLELQIGGRGGVPADAGAALVNIAAVRGVARGFVTAYPCSATPPTSSNLNYEPRAAASSAAFVTLDSSGRVCLFASSGVDLIVDVNGYVPKVATLSPLVPARLLDTRGNETVDGAGSGAGRVGGGEFIEVQVRGRGEVPADAESAIVNVTVVRPAQNTFVTVYACDADRPNASNLNVPAGRTVTNLVLADLSASGSVCVFTNRASHLVVDVSAFVPAGGDLSAVLPARLLETRSDADGTVDGDNVGAGPIPAGVTELQVAGRGPVPDGATGVMLNVGAIRPGARGFMTLYACDADQPDASNINVGAGAVVSNAVFVALDDDGRVCIASIVRSDAIVDVVGYVEAT